MDFTALQGLPLVTELNRVQRFYTGGRLLNKWQGLPEGEDGPDSEEFLLSTVKYIGFGHPAEDGISRTRLPDGTFTTLTSLIASDAAGFLGARYAPHCHGHSGVLARAGDSSVRLVLQCHPTAEKAKALLGAPFGKAEAWVIADTRVIDGVAPHLYCGFREGVTRELWRELFERQDIPAMLDCLHRFEVQIGDIIVIEAGMPHAMGSGCLFVEIHEACDYTIRPERNYLTRVLSDDEMHYGLGFDALLDFFDYTPYSEAQIRAKCFPAPRVSQSGSGGVLTELVTYRDTPRFAVSRLDVNGEYSLPDFDGHYILITLRGNALLQCGGKAVAAPQGRGVFVPARAKGLCVRGSGQIILAYPFLLPE